MKEAIHFKRHSNTRLLQIFVRTTVYGNKIVLINNIFYRKKSLKVMKVVVEV